MTTVGIAILNFNVPIKIYIQGIYKIYFSFFVPLSNAQSCTVTWEIFFFFAIYFPLVHKNNNELDNNLNLTFNTQRLASQFKLGYPVLSLDGLKALDNPPILFSVGQYKVGVPRIVTSCVKGPWQPWQANIFFLTYTHGR